MRNPVASLVLATCAVAAGAAEPAPPAERLLACADLADQSARLACFDREVAPLVRARREPQTRAPAPSVAAPVAAPRAASTPPVAPAPAAAAATPAFGSEQLKPIEKGSAASTEILHARITASTRGGQGTYLVTLDNGQVWRHEEGSQMEYLKVGEAVTITRAALGSYRLTIDSLNSGKWVRVSRVR